MKNFAEEFKQILETENKEKAVEYALALLNDKKIDVIALYSEILAPALNNMYCSLSDKNVCIWKEHVRTAIVRTIVECCYPYVIDKRNKDNTAEKGTAVILCPPEEYHDLGARMVADFLTISGYNAVFVGSNTPYSDFYNAVEKIKPDLIAISVSNYYNLVVTKKIIEDLRKKTDSKIIVGGYAFSMNSDNAFMVGADYYAETFENIKNIVEKEAKI